MRVYRMPALVLFLFLSVGSVCFSDDGDLLATFGWSSGFGIGLIGNDANTDLVLYFTTITYENNQYPIGYDLHVAPLRRAGDGSYSSLPAQSVFHSTLQIPQVTSAYDPVSRRYLIALLNGEVYGDERSIVTIALDLDGAVIGTPNTIAIGGIGMNFPVVCAVPAQMANKPKKANFLLAFHGYVSATQDAGILTQFLGNSGKPVGGLTWSMKETSGAQGKTNHEPLCLAPRPDNKGYLIGCQRTMGGSKRLPVLVALGGSLAFIKSLVLSGEEMLYESLALQPVAKKKLVVAWVDKAMRRFWSAGVPVTLARAGAAKLVSDAPQCTGDYDRPYPILHKRTAGAIVDIFCVGDRPDQTIHHATLNKTGVPSAAADLTPWTGIGRDIQYAYENWFAVIPISGTADYYGAAVFRMDEGLVIRGFVIPGS